MFWQTIRMDKVKKVKMMLDSFPVTIVEQEIEHPTLQENQIIIGVDPGINYGITFLSKNLISVIWGRLPRKQTLVGFEAIDFARVMSWAYHPDAWLFSGRIPNVYIEGPSYGDTVGQPLLEQVRFGFAVGFHQDGCPVHYLPPMSARKLAFGSGKTKGSDVWVNINPNGADSVGLALAGAILSV